MLTIGPESDTAFEGHDVLGGQGMAEATASLRNATVDESDRTHARDTGHDVVILPTRRTENGLGVYDQSLVFAVKELRAHGVDAAYLDRPETRRFEILESAALHAVLTVASNTSSGLLTAAILAGVGRVLRPRGDDSPLEVRVVDTSGLSSREYVIRGSADDVLAAIDKLEPRRLFDPAPDVDRPDEGEPSGDDAP